MRRILDHPSPPVVALQRRVTLALIAIAFAGVGIGRVSGGTYSSVTATGALTDLHIAGATVSGATTAGGTVITNVTGLPAVAGGMTDRMRAYFYGAP